VAIATSFYDTLAPHYHLLYADWERSVSEQGKALSSLLQELGVGLTDPVHDAACGIGTQTIGLAQLGHNVSASDISPGAVERLMAELRARGLSVPSQVDDFRLLQGIASGTLAAVLACDNSVPHLLSDAEIGQAFRIWWQRLRPGGVVVISVRDYAMIPRINPDVRPYGLRYYQGTRFLAVQVWEWDGEQYDLSIYLTSEGREGQCQTQVLRSRYYAVSIERLCSLLEDAAFVEIDRRDDVLFQPVIVARKPFSTFA
jgi:SAM-dependent methyltransferase